MCKLQFTTHERFLVYLPRVEFSNPEHLSGRGAAKFSLTAHAASFTGLSLRSRSDDLRSRPSLYLYACSSLRSAHGGFWSALSSVFLRSASANTSPPANIICSWRVIVVIMKRQFIRR